MSLSKPIWNSNLAGMFIRLPLAAYFLISGYVILQNQAPYLDAIRELNFFPQRLAILYGAILPYLQLTAGTLLFIGLWTNVAAIMAALMLLSFIYAIGIFPYNQAPLIFNKDIFWFFGALSLLASGPGGFSIDGQKQG